MLWDDNYLYIAAELEEPNVTGTLTKHDSVIFKDNDFEVFIKPLPETKSYYEFEMNALNTGWDLFLPKPYSENGKPDNSWDIAGLKTAVAIQGTLNKSTDTDRGWTLEIAYPLTAFESRQQVPPPAPGTVWRINFSRVEWKPGNPKEDNWVWSPQGVINMHVPDSLGLPALPLIFVITHPRGADHRHPSFGGCRSDFGAVDSPPWRSQPNRLAAFRVPLPCFKP